jgi:hypothetical protein
MSSPSTPATRTDSETKRNLGETGTDEYFLDPDPCDIKKLEMPFIPNRSGELYLYVNEAVLPIFMNAFYRNNTGTATVTVSQRDKGCPYRKSNPDDAGRRRSPVGNATDIAWSRIN